MLGLFFGAEGKKHFVETIEDFSRFWSGSRVDDANFWVEVSHSTFGLVNRCLSLCLWWFLGVHIFWCSWWSIFQCTSSFPKHPLSPHHKDEAANWTFTQRVSPHKTFWIPNSPPFHPLVISEESESSKPPATGSAYLLILPPLPLTLLPKH
jgi:hypothetical protein